MHLARAVPLTKLRLAAAAATLAVASVLIMTSQAVAGPADHNVVRWQAGAKPIIVLEHGAWADASSWDKVIQQLQEDGYIVYAPPNPLRGLPQDSAYLHDFLTQNTALAGQPVVLVGHSYGGAVIT